MGTGKAGPSTSPSQSPAQSQRSGNRHMFPWGCLAAPPHILSDSQTPLEQKEGLHWSFLQGQWPCLAKLELKQNTAIPSPTVTVSTASQPGPGLPEAAEQTQQHTTPHICLCSSHSTVFCVFFTKTWSKLALLTYSLTMHGSGLYKETPAQTQFSAWGSHPGKTPGHLSNSLR